MQKKKITKRQRKSMYANVMVKLSRKFGKELSVGSSLYIGANPVYQDLNEFVSGKMPNFVKVQCGTPFVRA